MRQLISTEFNFTYIPSDFFFFAKADNISRRPWARSQKAYLRLTRWPCHVTWPTVSWSEPNRDCDTHYFHFPNQSERKEKETWRLLNIRELFLEINDFSIYFSWRKKKRVGKKKKDIRLKSGSWHLNGYKRKILSRGWPLMAFKARNSPMFIQTLSIILKNEKWKNH